MKRSVLFFMFLMASVLTSFAQEVWNEEIPLESLTLKKGNLPPEVIKAAEEIFKGSTQVEWGAFPNEFKDYGWEKDKDYSEPIDHFEVHMKASDGTDVYAVFESTGELIRYRTINKNAAIPAPILNAISKTNYKTWKVLGGVEKVTDKQRKVVEHYTVRLENGKQKKTLYYTMNGKELVNK